MGTTTIKAAQVWHRRPQEERVSCRSLRWETRKARLSPAATMTIVSRSEATTTRSAQMPPPIYGGGSGPRTQMDALMNHPALPVARYCASSILMTVVNKLVVSGAHFTMNLLLLAIQ